jgi:phosphoribosylformimino-5-aminoimidazole carboxamide ribotide isomerase
MLVIPRIDVVGGLCVRFGDAAPFGSDDPITAARAWAAEGFTRLQVVDGDAVAGRGSNSGLIEVIGRDGSVEIDLSTKSESSDQIDACLDAGATRVVLGPRAIAEPEWLETVSSEYPSTLIVETSVRERRVVTRGWVRTLPVDILDLVESLAGVPLGGLVIAALDAGSGGGLELSLLEDVADACAFPVLVEDTRPTMGGFRALEHRGLGGVVVPAGALAASLDPRGVANEFGR